MSAFLQHNDPKVFPNPERFQPQRWLGQEEKGEKLGRYLVAFGEGSLNCIGSTMAYSLLYKSLAVIHRSFELKWRAASSTRICNMKTASWGCMLGKQRGLQYR